MQRQAAGGTHPQQLLPVHRWACLCASHHVMQRLHTGHLQIAGAKVIAILRNVPQRQALQRGAALYLYAVLQLLCRYPSALPRKVHEQREQPWQAMKSSLRLFLADLW
jgi:hypothetical protein